MRTYEIGTPVGLARAFVHEATGRRPRGSRPVVLVLGHGAGGGVQARDLAAVAARLPARGVTTVLVEQPWRVAGGRVAAAPARLDRAWAGVLAAPVLADLLHVEGCRLAVGGRSAGARVACRTAVATGADLVVCLAFPLHPPGRPERSRVDELTGAGLPALVVQGERDPFGGPAEITAAVLAAGVAGRARPEVVPVPQADHGFAVPARAELTQGEALEIVTDAVAGFLLRPAGRAG
ncbi:MAG: alpha/beta family hydrolase [Actinomycetes bacterium]